MSESENRRGSDSNEDVTEDQENDEQGRDEDQASEELRPREEDMELAAKLVIQADKLDYFSATADDPDVIVAEIDNPDAPIPSAIDPDANRTGDGASSNPPSVIAVHDDISDGLYAFGDELDSVTQSIPFVFASLARDSKTMSAEALEERFQQITEMLVSMQQRQYEALTSQRMPSSSLASTGQYSEALEQRFQQMMQVLDNMQRQQYETLRHYEEQSNQLRRSNAEPTQSLSSSERTPSLAATEQTVSLTSSEPTAPYGGSDRREKYESPTSPDSELSTKTIRDCNDPPCASFLRQLKSLPEKKERRYPKPDPPAMQVLLADAIEKLDPDGTIQTNEIDSGVRQEKLTPIQSLQALGAEVGHINESDIDRKLPARDTAEVPTVSDDSPMHVPRGSALKPSEPSVEIQTDEEDTWETRPAIPVGAIPVKEMQLNVWAPPGQLDIAFAEDIEPPTISAIKRSSPIAGSLEVGDQLIKVDDDDVRWMSSIMVGTLLACKSDAWRELSVNRSVRVGAGDRPVSRGLVGRSAVASLESSGGMEHAGASTSEISEAARAKYRLEVESLVRLLAPGEIDNVNVMMDWSSGREAELVSTLRSMQERCTAQRERTDREGTSDCRRPTSDTASGKDEADTQSQQKSDQAASMRETTGREPPGTTPLQPRRPPEPGAIRVGGVDQSVDDATVTIGSVQTESGPGADTQEPIEATVVSATDSNVQISMLTEAVISLQQQIEASHRGPSCRDRFEMCITCLFCLRTRPSQ